MSAETIYCDVQVRAASWYVDPEPAEYCEEKVENEGDLCPKHEPDDEPEYEREADL
ncbi:hypothetical protein QFZ79_002939 [Arthrobacter sp. V4I6]|uniref:hypothetical protein n=1 Tax=Arthrobacter sp. V4I6 TaxID=3042281 RepID=UPI0027805326|nr:hypothetical protein [Arthrobacter sp. V4I6]MDQ0854828.1 hypothetical protein [Arthrobacter sp. V4I6]